MMLKIKKDTNRVDLQFGDINIGEVFKVCITAEKHSYGMASFVCMKIPDAIANNGEWCNAVALDNGDIVYVSLDTPIVLLDGTLSYALA